MTVRKWGGEQLVNTAVAGNQINSTIAHFANGGFAIVWQDNSGVNSRILMQCFDAAGNPSSAETVVIDSPGNNFTNPSATGLADGNVLVTYTQENGGSNYIEGYIFNPSGARLPHYPITYSDFPVDKSDVAAWGSNVIATWSDPNSTDIQVTIRDPADTGATFTANTATAGLQHDSAVAVDPFNNHAIVVWVDDALRGIEGSLVFPNGGVDGFGLSNVSLISDDELSAPDVTWLTADTFVVTWSVFRISSSGGFDIYAEIMRLTPDNSVRSFSGRFKVDSSTDAGSTSPQVTALPDGRFVVTWQTYAATLAGDTSGTSIHLQAFDALGARQGGEYIVNTTTANNQADPAITSLSDGRVVVSWTDYSSGNGDIRMQIIDPRDGVVQGTAASETLYGNDSLSDEISGFDGNDTLYGLKGNDALYGGAGNDMAFGGAGDDVIYGGAGNDDLRGGNGDDSLFGEDGNDAMTGGAGADSFDGGAGQDTVTYALSKSAVTAALDNSLAGTGDAAGDTFLRVENLTGSNLAAAGDVLRGDSARNAILGLAGNDMIEGGAGNDKITGGAGADNLKGGAGNDVFIYLAITDAGDSISDFSSAAPGNNDSFQFKGSAFGGLPAGGLLAAQFQSSTAAAAATPDVRFFYETDTGILRFDPDGSLGGVAPTIIATLQPGATMTIADIVIV